jgi:NADH-quinone oxidoreductase subunit N
MVFLAQIGELAPDSVAWSSFAAELPPAIVALVLLLVAIARGRPMLVLGPAGLIAIATGVWLATLDQPFAAVVTILLGVAGPVLALAFPRRVSMIQAWGAGLALVAALAVTGWQWAQLNVGMPVIVPQSGLEGAIANDGIAFFTRLTVYFSALVVIPLGYGYLQDRRINRAEVEPLLLICVVGMAALGTANDLITLFIALEVLSIALYVLAGLARRDRRSQEASLKYFVTGSVASAILLYGMALVYVATGSVELPAIGGTAGIITTPTAVAAIGLGLVMVGMGFKVSLAPFHLWTPDVYQGSPTPITAFMAAATKAAGIAALLRLVLVALPEQS